MLSKDFVAVVLSILCAVLTVPSVAEAFHVSPGDDIQQRLDQWVAAETPGVLELGPGTYTITEALRLGPEHSGLTMRGAGPDKTILHGGKAITGWRQEGDVWVADIPEVKSGDWDFSAIFVNGERRDPARTPNSTNYAGDYPTDDDFFYADGPVMVEGPDGKQQASNTQFRFREGDIEPWETLDDAVFVIFHSWATSLLRVKEVDWERRVITFTGPARWPFCRWKHDQWYFIQHLKEALDAPGEWFLDRAAGKLYYMPMPDEDMSTAEIIAPVTQQFLVAEGDPANGAFIDDLTLEGIGFQYGEYPVAPEGHSDAQAAFAVPAAVQLTGARNAVIRECEVAHVGAYGVWFRAGCKDGLIESCELRDLGAGGVRIGEGASPDSEAEATERITVRNNYLHDGGRIFRSAVGVWIGRSSYNLAAHNDVSDFRYSGFSVGWSWGYQPSSAHHNIIEYNHIHDVGKGQLSDMGGIYTLGVSPGTVLRGNYIHDVLSNPNISGGWGLYTDEGSTDILMENNVVHHTRTGTFHQHYGRENVLRNNILAFSEREQIIRSREEDHISFILDGNIIYFSNGRLLGSRWGNDNWKMDNNIYWDTSGQGFTFAGDTFAEWQERGHDVHSVIADPLFEDIEGRHFTLKPDSPALEMGFEPIDVARAGMQKRPAWMNDPADIEREPFTPPQPPPPFSVRDGFEETAVGALPAHATVSEDGKGTIRVTDETAFEGDHCLAINDAAGLAKSYNPHMFYEPHFRKGTATVRFAIRLDEQAVVYHEWRDNNHPYRVGPSLWFHADGRVMSQNEEIAQAPAGAWIRVEVRAVLGEEAAGVFDLTLTPKGSEPQAIESLPFGSKDFTQLDWCGFVANADADAKTHLDALVIEKLP
ncbi:MAG: right-handed parallel beta-helix repeat-containing protein [Candidatus Hydrogenedentota bacterium]